QACKLLDCEKALAELKPILENPKVKKIGHNLKYDLLAMRQVGVHVRGIAMDTMIAAFLIDASRIRYNLAPLALDLLNFKKISIEELIGKGKNQTTMDRVDTARIACYAAEDADIALRLAELFDERLADMPAIRKLMDEIETPLIDVLVEMETNG